MITSINKIIGIGKFDNYVSPVALNKNQIIFGFNGAGKSTLSDIFYSLSDDEHCKKLMERKTLNKDDGSIPDNPSIELGTDGSILVFENEKWNGSQNIYVFNDQYIEDYSTVLQNFDMARTQIVLGKEATKLSHKRAGYINDWNNLLDDINNVIINNRAVCERIKLGKLKINAKSWEKRITTIANTKLFNVSQKKEIEKELENKRIYNANYILINDWKDSINRHHRYYETQALSLINGLEKLLLEVPTVTNKELNNYINSCMKHMDVNWLITGMYNITSNKLCPFCGRPLQDDFVEKLSNNLEKYIKGKQKKKSDKIISYLNKVLPFFDEAQLEGLFNDLYSIKNENEKEKRLLKKTSTIIESMLIATELEPNCFSDICNAIKIKIRNPFSRIVLQDKDRNILKSLANIIKKISKLDDAFEHELRRINEKIQKEEVYEQTSALYTASFGENADEFKRMIVVALLD